MWTGGRKAKDAGVNAAALALATALHVAMLGYLALYLRPFQPPPLELPMIVELVQTPPPIVRLTPPRGRLDASELPRTQPRPPPPSPPQPQPPLPPPPPQPEAPPAPPRPAVLAASIPELATPIPPEPQAPKPIIPALQAAPRPEFLPDSYQDVLPTTAPATATAPAATLAPSLRPIGPLSTNAAAAQALREAAGAAQPGAPAGSPGSTAGVDDRWRVRPDGRPYADCPPIPPERMTGPQRARCFPAKAPARALAITREYPLKDARFEDAARRKELLRKYRASPAADYPGLNCALRGKCPK